MLKSLPGGTAPATAAALNVEVDALLGCPPAVPAAVKTVPFTPLGSAPAVPTAGASLRLHLYEMDITSPGSISYKSANRIM